MEDEYSKIDIKWKTLNGERFYIGKAIGENGEVIQTMHFRVLSHVADLPHFYARLGKLPDPWIEEFVREEIKFKLENPDFLKETK